MSTPIHVPDLDGPSAQLCWKQSSVMARCDRRIGHPGAHSWEPFEVQIRAPNLRDLGADGAVQIAAERLRQIVEEGYDAGHDDQHNQPVVPDGPTPLLAAACAYIGASFKSTEDDADPAEFWPFERERFKPTDPVSNLVKAGAFLAAEIDRLRRRAALAAQAERV